ncbi:FAD-dependent oxidoreductase, partial [Legionella steigerwaltii]
MTDYDDGDKHPDLVIVGMGPVGLAAAYEAARNGNKVLIVEKRTEKLSSIRPQVVVLSPERKNQLIAMINKNNDQLSDSDIKFLDTLAGSAEVKIASVQKFILNRINNLNKQHRREKESNGMNAINILYETTLESVDPARGIATMKSKDGPSQEIGYQHLVAADGGRSQTLALVNAKLEKRDQIKRSTPLGMKHIAHTFHLGAYVKLSRADGQPLVLPEREFTSSFMDDGDNSESHRLYFLRFEKKSHDKSNKKSVKMGFIGEVPKEIYDQYQEYLKEAEDLQKKIGEIDAKLKINANDTDLLSEKEKLESSYQSVVTEAQKHALAYAKKAAAKYMNVKESELNIELTPSKKTPEKDKLKILAFQGNSQLAGKAAIRVNDHGFYLIGDAYFTPNYALGHGLNDGLEAAAMIGKIPKKESKQSKGENVQSLQQHLSEYNKLNAKNSNFIRMMMQVIRWFRKLGVTRIKLADMLETGVSVREESNKIDLKKSVCHTIDRSRAGVDRDKDCIERYIEKKFNAEDVNKLITYGLDYYSMGFLSEDAPGFKGKSKEEQIAFLRQVSESNGNIPILLPWRLKVDYSHAAYLVSFFLKKFIILNSLNCILV